MNIDQIKEIPVGTIVEKLGGEFEKNIGQRDRYKSPFREEKKGSFFVFINDNKWTDFGNSGGKPSGDGLDLICEYLRLKGSSHTTKDGLAHAREILNGISNEKLTRRNVGDAPDNTLVIDQVRDELSPSTLRYVRETRNIQDRGLIRQYVKQVHFHFEKTPDIRLYGAGLKSDKGGFEIRGETKNNNFKYAGGEKSITKIKGTDRSRLSIFEGGYDFLTHLDRNNLKVPETDVIILNSTNLLKDAIPVIHEKQYTSIDVFRDNDQAGIKMFEALKAEFPKTDIQDKSILYKGFEDYNEMHRQTAQKKSRSLS